MPNYNDIYNTLVEGKSPSEVDAIKSQFKSDYDFDADSQVATPPTEGKKSPVPKNVDATVQENTASDSVSSGDSSDSKEDKIPQWASGLKANFDAGEFTGDQREAMEAYKAGDKEWWKKANNRQDFGDVQDDIDSVATEKFNKEDEEKRTKLDDVVAQEANDKILEDPGVKTAVESFVDTLDMDGKQQELIKQFDLANHPENEEKATEALNKWD